MLVTQDGLELINQGTIISLEKSETRIEIENGTFVKFKFKSDDSVKKPFSKVSLENDDLVVTFFNFINPKGTASPGPVLIATLDSTEIYLSSAIYSIGDESGSTKIIHYNWYKKEVSHE